MNPTYQILINPVHIHHYLIVGITNNHLPKLIQESGPLKVLSCLISMIMTINLDHKPYFGAVEINNKVTNRFLAQEFVIGKLPHAQGLMPHPSLGWGGIFAVFAGEGGEIFVVREERLNPSHPPLIRGGVCAFPPDKGGSRGV
ncbi:MAG: hypothetical protein Q8N54_07970 [Sulfurimicrobium sp.]|nr:hypothetical protein [Sulfurimicrobium sp.]